MKAEKIMVETGGWIKWYGVIILKEAFLVVSLWKDWVVTRKEILAKALTSTITTENFHKIILNMSTEVLEDEETGNKMLWVQGLAQSWFWVSGSSDDRDDVD